MSYLTQYQLPIRPDINPEELIMVEDVIQSLQYTSSMRFGYSVRGLKEEGEISYGAATPANNCLILACEDRPLVGMPFHVLEEVDLVAGGSPLRITIDFIKSLPGIQVEDFAEARRVCGVDPYELLVAHFIHRCAPALAGNPTALV